MPWGVLEVCLLENYDFMSLMNEEQEGSAWKLYCDICLEQPGPNTLHAISTLDISSQTALMNKRARLDLHRGH